MADIAIIGTGSWGTALASLLGNNNHKVTLWSAFEEEINMLKEFHEHKDKLPGVILKGSVSYTTDISEALSNRDVIVLAVPSPFIRSTAHKMAEFIKDSQIIVNVAKGIEEKELQSFLATLKKIDQAMADGRLSEESSDL